MSGDRRAPGASSLAVSGRAARDLAGQVTGFLTGTPLRRGLAAALVLALVIGGAVSWASLGDGGGSTAEEGSTATDQQPDPEAGGGGDDQGDDQGDGEAADTPARKPLEDFPASIFETEVLEMPRAVVQAQIRREARRAERIALIRTPPPAAFRTATLNVLGDSHTARGGNKPGMASGAARMSGAVRLLNDYDISIVALQEFEQVQKGAFNNLTGGSWAFHAGSEKARDAVAWRTDTWTLVESGYRTTPYFGGEPIPTPWVLLEHVDTGRRIHAISLHNPTSNPRRGNNAGHRAAATNIQVQLSRELNASGHPVLLMGDFNEKDVAFCRVAGGGLFAANGGSGSPCSPPPAMGIDWIFGLGDMTFTDYLRVDGPGVASVTDHPLIVASVDHSAPLPEALVEQRLAEID